MPGARVTRSRPGPASAPGLPGIVPKRTGWKRIRGSWEALPPQLQPHIRGMKDEDPVQAVPCLSTIPVHCSIPSYSRSQPRTLGTLPFPSASLPGLLSQGICSHPLECAGLEGSVPTPVLAAAIGLFPGVAKHLPCSEGDPWTLSFSKASTIQASTLGEREENSPRDGFVPWIDRSGDTLGDPWPP